jgi:MFS family permease
VSSVPSVAPGRRLSAATRRTFRSLKVRNYRLWFVGQSISLCGTWMQSVAQYALVEFVLKGSALDLGITAALQFGPVLVLGVFGGVLADRFNKRKVVLITQSAFLVQALALWLLVFTGAVQLWMVWALALVMGIINAIDNPSRQSFVIEMVGPDDLANAIGLNSVIVNSSRIVGPAAAGILMVTAGLSWTFLINAITYVAVLTALLAMRRSELRRVPRVARAKGQVRAGLRYAWGAWQLRVPLLMMAVIGTLAYNFSVVLPLYADDVFRRGEGTYGALMTAMGVGALVGALMVASRRRPGYRLLVAVALVFGVSELAVAAAPSLLFALALLVPMGAGGVAFIAITNTLLQLHAADEMRGRVMALWAIVFLGSTPIGAPLTGLVAGHWGVRVAMAGAALAVLLTVAGGGLALRRIRAGQPAKT